MSSAVVEEEEEEEEEERGKKKENKLEITKKMMKGIQKDSIYYSPISHVIAIRYFLFNKPSLFTGKNISI